MPAHDITPPASICLIRCATAADAAQRVPTIDDDRRCPSPDGNTTAREFLTGRCGFARHDPLFDDVLTPA